MVHAVPELAQWPLASQVCGCLPLHVLSTFGSQSVHTPGGSRQKLLQVVVVHLPLWLQVCALPLLHFVLPGLQLPVQEPSVHTYGQAVALSHAPSALQVCGTVPLHCVSSGLHSPIH